MKNFLHHLFSILNEQFEYAVLRNYDSLPEEVGSQDIDILIEKKDLSRFLKYLPKIIQQTGVGILYSFRDHQFLTYVFLCRDYQVVQIDFQYNFAWMGIDLLDERKVLKKRVFNGKVWHLPPDYTFLPKYLYSRILGAKYPDKYESVKQAAFFFNRAGIETELWQIAGRNFDSWEHIGKWNLRFLASISAVRRAPLRAMKRSVSFIYCAIRDILFRRSLMVSFSGPDGCGKSTVIDLLCQRFQNSPPILFHFRPSLLPNLGEVAHKAKVIKEVDRNFDQPHRGRKKGVLSSFIRLGYYCFDYSIGYVVKVLPLRQRKQIVFFDRYFTDVIVDSERSSIYLSPKFIACFRFLLPRCRYNFLFRVDPERILARKKELTLEDMAVIYSRLDYLAAHDRRYNWIDNNGTPEEAVNQILDVLAKQHGSKYAKHLAK